MRDVSEQAAAEGLPPGFVELAASIYALDDEWVPEDADALASRFSVANAWFRQGDARVFLVPEEVRAVAFLPRNLRIDGERVAFFGYYESKGSQEAEDALFKRLEEWVAGEGAECLYGPVDFSTYGNYRIRLTAEANARTFQSEPHNPAYYADSFTRAGYALAQTYYAQIADPRRMAAMVKAHGDPIGPVEAAGYRFEPLTVEKWMSRHREMHALADQTFAQNFAYTPLPYEAFAKACGESFVRKACPHTSALVMAPEGEVAGFCLTYPNYGPIIRKGAGGARVAASTLDFATHFDALSEYPPRMILLKTFATGLQHRRKGILNAMACRALDIGAEYYAAACGAIMRSDNPTRSFGRNLHHSERTYGLFKKGIALR